MRTFVIAAIAAAALVVTGASQPATTAVTKNVNITATAFTPASVTIKTGDSIKWTNKDTKTHQVVSNSGAFASGIISPEPHVQARVQHFGHLPLPRRSAPVADGQDRRHRPAACGHHRSGRADHHLRTGDAHLRPDLERPGRRDRHRLRPEVRRPVRDAHRDAADRHGRRLGHRRDADPAHDLPGALEEHAQLDRSGRSPSEGCVHALAPRLRRGQGHHEPLDEGPQGLHPAPHALW